MTFTIEPMINAGRRDVRLLPDGWTVVTKDQSLSAQWEHTILVTDPGYEVLTLGASVAALPRRRGGLLNAHGKFLDQTADWPYLTAAPEALQEGQFSPTIFRQVLDRGTRAAQGALRGRRGGRRSGARPRAAGRHRAARRLGARTPASLRTTWRWLPSAATGAASCTRVPTSTSWCSCRRAIRPTGSRTSSVS